MSISVTNEGRCSRVAIDGDLSIYQAAEAWQVLMGTVQDAQREIEVDLKGVEEVDSAGIQVLMMSKRMAAGAGKEMRLVNHGDQVLEVIELLNLGAVFGDPLVLRSEKGGRR